MDDSRIKEERARVASAGELYRLHESALVAKYGRAGWIAIWPETGNCVWALRAEDLCNWFGHDDPLPCLAPCGWKMPDTPTTPTLAAGLEFLSEDRTIYSLHP